MHCLTRYPTTAVEYTNMSSQMAYCPNSESTSTTRLWLLLFATGAFFAMFGSSRSLWLDEAFSANIARLGVSGILDALKADSHPPLYYLLLAGWTRLWGESEIALRSLSGIFYLMTIPIIYAIVRASGCDGRTAGIGTLLFLIAKPAIAHAQNVRMYSLLALMCALTLLAFVRAYRRPDSGWEAEVIFVLIGALGLFVHLWFSFALAGMALAYLLVTPRDRWLRVSAAIGMASLPFAFLWLPILMRYQIRNPLVSLAPPDAWTIPATFADFYGGGWIGGLVYAACAAAMLLRWRQNRLAFITAAELRAMVPREAQFFY